MPRWDPHRSGSGGVMIELPYGIADFHTIRQQGLAYVDRTAYIRELERRGRPLVFLRPRRFGKSLWLDTLANYYDLTRRDEFDELFGELDVGRDPTPLANSYFVMTWDFSELSGRGDGDKIAADLNEYVNSQIEDFVTAHSTYLTKPVRVKTAATNTLRHLLTAIRETSSKLYLLIDEYDNFINEVMVADPAVYRGLVETGGPFKELFKSIKSAMRGQGIERVFVTGVSPVALNDITSGFNIAKNLSLDPDLAGLCGFREQEIRDLLAPIAGDRDLDADAEEEIVDTMRTWYNGYRFTDDPAGDDEELVYNPTNVLYFLDHLSCRGTPPQKLYDQNLRTDRGKLAFLARSAAGAGVIEQLTAGGDEVTVAQLEESFSIDDLTARLEKDQNAVASMLYYMGLLTLTDVPERLRIPNLVVRKLFLDRLLEIHLTDIEDSSGARRLAMNLFRDGNLEPLLAFFEDKLLPVLSNRDRGAAPQGPGRSGSGVNETGIKTLFLSILFDDTRYVTWSEVELGQEYADLCLLVRPEMRRYGYYDLLFEFKLVRRRELGKKGRELREMDEDALRELPPVRKALAEARDQAERYRAALVRSQGAETLNLRTYVVVAVGLERMLGEESANERRT
ncbi:MAG: AAA family ATPase [bacterium]|nr:AAA family ATPase [bacterium]